ncbi:MAG TPA: hypothetical protein VGP55_10950 [Chitinophagaceae bacterium]|nr:hypothetical protein [Chitinophagaceae bacterium]
MQRFICLFFLISVLSYECKSQSAPNFANSAVLSPSTGKASKLGSVPVNIFTGVPQVGVPIYSYNNSNNGLSFNISLDYFAGGAQAAEGATTAGLGWFLNTGGIITRTVRGAPDDQPTNGFMYAAAIPTDYRSNGNKYYFDTLDAQQDIFQYSFNGRSGKFYIGKNNQIVVVPTSKIRIIPTIGTGAYAQRIIAFRVITEDGVKYDFNNAESTVITTSGVDSSLFRSAYSGQSYYSSWRLGQIISTFNTDTIRINYTQTPTSNNFAYPQVTFVRNSDGVRTKTFAPTGTNSSTEVKVSSVVFPEKTQVTFIYGTPGITRIKISDTTFRYGYLLTYITSYTDPVFGNISIRPLLSTLTPYTSKEKMNGYYFSYKYPFLPGFTVNGSFEDGIDYWGFRNTASNGSNSIPNVNGYSWGANRNPDSAAIGCALTSFTIPDGGTINYDYELNDHLPYTKDPHKIIDNPTTASSSTVLFNQVFNSKHQLTFMLDSTVSRSGSAPISGTGNLTVNIKNNSGTITYASYSLPLYDLFYEGIKSFAFNVPNGNYLLDIPAITGTTITGSFPINVTWENKLTDTTHTAILSGGLRVKRVTRKNMSDDVGAVSVQEYKYINTNGTSSGFLGDVPKYDYPYQETVNFGGIRTTSYTAVGSEPVNTMDYAQGSPVGYSRVEVYSGTTTHNIGKTVYEFTNMQDANSGVFTESFPYGPEDLRDWAIGLPKKVSVYDTTGRLLKKTLNTYTFDTTLFINNNFKSIKLGNSFTYYSGDSSNPATPKTRTYIAQEYYPITGRAYIVSTVDSIFQANGSLNNSYANITYDTNFNVTKVVSSYDRNRGLQLERRMYYPYNYSISGSIGKLRDSSIISALISSEDWITGDANPRILSGTITDYQQTGNYIKPLTVYFLQANHPVLQTIIGTFNPATLNRSSTYFVAQNSFISYDSKGNLLQSQNVQSGINNSVIMDYGKQYPIAKVTNAAVNDIAYTSFESDGAGNWTISSTLRDSLNSLTGKKSYNLSNGNITKSSLTTTTSYLVTLWAKSGSSVSVNGTSLSTIIASQIGWNLFSTLLTGISTVTISGSGQIDELRLHPKDANMVTTTYEPTIGPTSTTDANNTVIYNEYDNLNRLKIVRDKDKNILKRYDFSDISIPISLVPVYTTYAGCRVDVSFP